MKLNPGPLYAIDGDFGIDDKITYKILGGEQCTFVQKVFFYSTPACKYLEIPASTCKSNHVFAPGNDGSLFEIDPNTGNVSMQKEANTLEPITLTVLVNTPSPPPSSHFQSNLEHSECSEYCVSFP